MSDVHPLIRYSRDAGKSVMEIAKDAGCSRMTLYRLVRGEQNATIDLLKRVSDATGGAVTAADFLPRPASSDGRA